MQQTRFKWRELFRTLAPFWRNSDRVVNNNAVTPGNTCICYHENYQEDDDLISLILGEMQKLEFVVSPWPFLIWRLSSEPFHITRREMVKQHLGKERKLPIDRVFISDGCQNICVGSSNVFDTVLATRKKLLNLINCLCQSVEQNWDSQNLCFSNWRKIN